MTIKHPTVRKFSPSRRLALFATLLALPVILAALSACNDEGADTTPTPIPPPTSAPYSGSERFFIVGGQSESLQISLLAGDVLVVTYSAHGSYTAPILPGLSPTPAPPRDVIEFQMIGTLGETVLQVEAQHENYVELRAEHTGVYQLVFTNPYRLQGLEVRVEYAINP